MSFYFIYLIFLLNKIHISSALKSTIRYLLTFALNENNDKARIFSTVTIWLFMGNVELGKRKSIKAQLLQQFFKHLVAVCDSTSR